MPFEITSWIWELSKLGNEKAGYSKFEMALESNRGSGIEGSKLAENSGMVPSDDVSDIGFVAGSDGGDGGLEVADASFLSCLAERRAISPSNFCSISATRLHNAVRGMLEILGFNIHILEFFARLGRGRASRKTHCLPSLTHLNHRQTAPLQSRNLD